MLNVTGLNHFYCVRDFTDMRCKHSRVLSIIRERLQIDSKKDVLSRETYSRNPINYSECMADDQKDRYIQYLAEQNHDLRLTSDACVEMAATYYSVIGTVKLHGSSIWNFIGLAKGVIKLNSAPSLPSRGDNYLFNRYIL